MEALVSGALGHGLGQFSITGELYVSGTEIPDVPIHQKNHYI
jgi:ABC-type uncharacterized transport system YnjBCD ATPase subunit